MPVLAGVFAAIFIPIIVLAFMTGGDGGSGTAPKDAVSIQSYGDAVAGSVEQAGAAIVLGIRPDISDFRAGHITADVWRTDMQTREQQFADGERTFSTTATPRELMQARSVFLDAFADYRLAAVGLHQAADETGAEREALIGVGVSLGDLGDRTFDRAATALQAVRRAAGLDADTRFPVQGGASAAGATAGAGSLTGGVALRCVHPGDTQSVVVRGVDAGSVVVFDSQYADGSNALTAPVPYAGGSGHGHATGAEFRVSWSIPARAPAGAAVVQLGGLVGGDGARTAVPFVVRPAGERC